MLMAFEAAAENCSKWHLHVWLHMPVLACNCNCLFHFNPTDET